MIGTHSTSTIQKGILLSIRITAISLLFFLSLSLSSALDFQLSSPSTADFKENFSVSIVSSVSEVYDVKIFVWDSNSAILSEVYDSGWKNPYYYLRDSFPNKTVYTLRVVKSSDKYEICARLRKSGKSTYTQKCAALSVSGAVSDANSTQIQSPADSSNNSETDALQDNPAQNNASSDNPAANSNNSQDDAAISNNSASSSAGSSQTSESNARIVLNSPSSKEFTTKEGNLGIWISLSFTVFCIVIIILLALKKL